MPQQTLEQGLARYYWPFAGASLLNFLFYRPSIDDLQAAVRAAKP